MLDATIAEAVRLFNAGEYFDFHEVVEERWKPLPPGSEKTFLQGWLQLGVGLYHWQNGNFHGTRSKLQSGLEKLETAIGTPDFDPPLDLTALVQTARQFLQRVQAAAPNALPPFPAGEIPLLRHV